MEKKDEKPVSTESQKPVDQALDDKALDGVSGGAKGATRNTGRSGGHYSK